MTQLVIASVSEAISNYYNFCNRRLPRSLRSLAKTIKGFNLAFWFLGLKEEKEEKRTEIITELLHYILFLLSLLFIGLISIVLFS